MVSLQAEDVAQHSFSVALIAQALCAIDREVFDREIDVGEVLSATLLHDATEALLTDVVAPVKKFSPAIQSAFSRLETLARDQMVGFLPPELQSPYRAWMDPASPAVSQIVHAADKLDALCRCRSEVRRGNQDFAVALAQIQSTVDGFAREMPAVRYFLDTFMPAFDHSIDEYRYLQAGDPPRD